MSVAHPISRCSKGDFFSSLVENKHCPDITIQRCDLILGRDRIYWKAVTFVNAGQICRRLSLNAIVLSKKQKVTLS